MTLNHSKTWPVNTVAVVQLRVDPHGRTYSTLADQIPLVAVANAPPESCSNCDNTFLTHTREMKSVPDGETQPKEDNFEDGSDNGVVLPLSMKHVEMFTKMSTPSFKTTIRTDTVSTTLEQDTEVEYENFDYTGKYAVKIMCCLSRNLMSGNLHN